MFESRQHRIRRFRRSVLPASMRPVSPDLADDLRFIRDTMERSAAFTAVSGWGTALLGCTAIAAAAMAARQLTPFGWLRIWLAEGLLAVAIGLLACTWKANRRGLPLLPGPQSGIRARAPARRRSVPNFSSLSRGIGISASRPVASALRRRNHDGRRI